MDLKTTPDYTYTRSFANGLEGKYELISRYIKPGDDVLELGCADGYFGQALISLGAQVTGIENVEQFAVKARERGLSVVSCDLDHVRAVEQITGQFDIILAMDVLEHLKDPGVCLSALRGKLKPGGKILVTGPNVGYWWIRLALLKGNWRYEKTGIMDETHLRFFTLDSWRELLEKSGFNVSNLGAAETGMLPGQRWLKKLIGARITGKLAEYLTRKRPNIFAIVVFMVGTRND